MDELHLHDTSLDLQERPEEQLQLREQNERLSTKVGYLESRLGYLAASNTDLSCRLVQSEEGKLQLSKELVEEKLQTNRLREQFAEETFELKNKLLTQAGVLTQLEMQRDDLSRELQSAEALLKMGEQSGRSLSEEHAALRDSYRSLAEAHGEELAQSGRLGAELLALARAQDQLRSRLQEQQQSEKTSSRDLHRELDRVKLFISRMEHSGVKLEDLAALDKEQKNMETTLLGNQEEIKDMLQKMKRSYEEQQKKLEQKVVSMAKEHQENKRLLHQRQQQLSEQSVALRCCQSRVKEAEEENSKLQLHLKELNEEYRARLLCYLRDLAEYVDGAAGRSEASGARAHLDGMLQEVRSSYRLREQQLAHAARSYRRRLQALATTHEALLTAYGAQRDQILSQTECGLDPGPPGASFSLEPGEEPEEQLHQLHQLQQLQQLRPDGARPERQPQAAGKQGAQKKDGCFEPPSLQVAVLRPVQSASRQPPTCEETRPDGEQQLGEMADSTRAAFEKERALLLTRAAVAEAQLWELQDYVDNHLGRYQEEVARLCRRRAAPEAARPHSAHPSLH